MARLGRAAVERQAKKTARFPSDRSQKLAAVVSRPCRRDALPDQTKRGVN
jgi:hypothetical protein